jgi:NO-binding membrane sensor protein with MHYT domain
MPVVLSETALAGTYDYRLVALSVLIAVLASYAALDLAGRVTTARGRARLIWLTAGSMTMGCRHLGDALYRNARAELAG